MIVEFEKVRKSMTEDARYLSMEVLRCMPNSCSRCKLDGSRIMYISGKKKVQRESPSLNLEIKYSVR